MRPLFQEPSFFFHFTLVTCILTFPIYNHVEAVVILGLLSNLTQLTPHGSIFSYPPLFEHNLTDPHHWLTGYSWYPAAINQTNSVWSNGQLVILKMAAVQPCLLTNQNCFRAGTSWH